MKIDFGCGPNIREGFIGVDQYSFDGKVDIVGDVTDPAFWIQNFKNDEIEEAHASHFIEHLTAKERIVFFNGLWRAMKAGSQLTMITPHWASSRAYGDPTHQWPPISEFFFNYLEEKWRNDNAPHTDSKYWEDGYVCNFTTSFGYNLHPALHARNMEYQQMAVSFFKEAALDMHATLTCVKDG